MKKNLFILTLLFSIGSYACTCDDVLPIEKAYKQSNTIITGKITSIIPYNPKVHKNGDEITEEYSNVTVKVEIIDSFKGLSKSTIEIITGIGGGDCGYEFIIGEEYLIFAYDDGIYTENSDGKLETNRCHGNGKISDRKEWLKYLCDLK